jgi:Flp pilus assembly protein TadG
MRIPRLREIGFDRSGMAAIEFALLLPVLLTLFIGSFETSNLLLAYLKLEAAAETAADLVAQTDVSDVLNDEKLDNITNAVKKVMTPLSTTGLKVAYASITYSTGKAKIDWSKEEGGASPITIDALPGGVNTSSMGSATRNSTDSLIVVRLTYPNVSPLSSYFNTNYTLTEWAYNRPRYVQCVPYKTSCP